jgi:hypothetical protein
MGARIISKLAARLGCGFSMNKVQCRFSSVRWFAKAWFLTGFPGWLAGFSGGVKTGQSGGFTRVRADFFQAAANALRAGVGSIKAVTPGRAGLQFARVGATSEITRVRVRRPLRTRFYRVMIRD